MHPLDSVPPIVILIALSARLCISCAPDAGCATTGTKLSCSGHINLTAIEHIERIRSADICGLNATTFHINAILDHVPNLSDLTVSESVVNRIEGHIAPGSEIKVVRLNNLSITEIDDGVFRHAKLEVLDLRNNRLKSFRSQGAILNEVDGIYLSGNQWNCSHNLNWILDVNRTAIKDIDELQCHGNPYPGKPLEHIARFLHNVRSNCPSMCKCSLPNVVRDPNTDALHPIAEVNCSGTELFELPSRLPAATAILRLDRNYISDLTPLVADPIYREVQDLYLDHNLVETIENLEGSYWLAHFRVLSLHGNKLSELPTYAFDNALQQNPNMPNAVRIYLGNNPWRCDCVFTPGFQDDMLVKYAPQIQDLDEVKCSYVQGDENSMLPIIQLSRSSVCRLPSEYSVRALDLLNGVLATLIVLVLGKLAYDYYYFKRTGRLPWIVTKMP